MRPWTLATLALVSALAVLPAPVGGADLLIGLRGHDGATGGDGAGVLLDVKTTDADELPRWWGLDADRQGDVRWAVARLGRAWRPGAGTVVAAELSGGGGEEADGRGFGYFSGRVELSRELVPRRLFLVVADRYFAISDVSANLVEGTAAVYPLDRWEVRVGYLASTGGTLRTRVATLRMGVDLGRVRLLGGIADGRGRPEFPDLADATDDAFDQGFVGFGLPFTRGEILVIGDRVRTAGGSRDNLLVAWRWSERRAE